MQIGSGNILNMVTEAEHAVVNGIPAKKVVIIDAYGNLVNGSPTAQTNPSTEYDYSNPNSIVIQETIGTDVYQQTITISAGVATEGAFILL